MEQKGNGESNLLYQYVNNLVGLIMVLYHSKETLGSTNGTL